MSSFKLQLCCDLSPLMLLPWLQKSHNETVSKLSFVLALVECIIDLAQSRSSPLSESVTEKVLSSSPGGGTAAMDHISFMSEGDRCIEQLVLYVRALQLLSSSIQLAKEEVSAGRLHPSNNVRACESFTHVLWLYLARSPCSLGVVATCSNFVRLPLPAPHNSVSFGTLSFHVCWFHSFLFVLLYPLKQFMSLCWFHSSYSTQHSNAFQCFIMSTAMKTCGSKADLILSSQIL